MAEPEVPPENGERLGAYRLLEPLGRGGMGEVFLAWDDRLRRRVAIKRLRRDQGVDPALRQRLLVEARAVASLSHPAIVHVYDLLESAAGDSIVMEYVQGPTLAALLAGGPLDLGLAARLAAEIAAGLAAAHAAGIVHRDLKPENVIVSPAGAARILDFGLARMRFPAAGDALLTQHGTLLGTFHMMSPEQARGDEADERSDLFSLGLLLYEMLTGSSPFRAAQPLETLRRITAEQPPPASSVRPGVPPRLDALLARLLAKDPGGRPDGAAEVARELAEIAAALGPAGPPRLPESGSVSDLPTGVVPPWSGEPRPAIARARTAPTSTAGMSSRPWRPRVRQVAVGALLAALAAAGVFLLARRPAGAAHRLRVVVPRPQAAGDDPALRLAAAGVQSATLATLGALDGVAPLDPLQLVGSPRTAVDMARVAAADEVLAATLEPAGALGRITLRRIRGGDGRVLWSDTFDAPIAEPDLRLLADAVGIRLRRGFSEHPPRAGAPPLDVGNEEYAAFLASKLRLTSGQSPPGPELARLERIAERSPRFPEARLLAADVALSLFQSTRDAAYRDRALALVHQAEELAPGDPRPLKERFRVELAADPPEAAEATLARLEPLLPEDPQLLALRASLAERRGRPREAIADLRTTVARVPSWQNLYRLAKLEARYDQIEDARRHLDRLLAGSPGNIWALQQLGEIELEFGDPARAERIYRGLIARSEQSNYLTNLGIARVLLRRYGEAVAAFRAALAIDPEHVETLLDLADAELALGRDADADAAGLYRKVLARLNAERPAAGASPADALTEAQCLAHLGRTREAVAIAQRSLQRSPDDPDVLQGAAQVYALAGDRASALVNVQGALEKGVQRRWFTLPAYRSLAGDPELRRLLGE